MSHHPRTCDCCITYDALSEILLENALGEGEAISAELFTSGLQDASCELTRLVNEIDAVDVIVWVIDLGDFCNVFIEVRAQLMYDCMRVGWLVGLPSLCCLLFDFLRVPFGERPGRIDVGDTCVVSGERQQGKVVVVSNGAISAADVADSLVPLQVNKDGLSTEITILETVKDEIDEVVQPASDDELDCFEHWTLEGLGESSMQLCCFLAFRLDGLEEGQILLACELVLEDGLIVEGDACCVRLVVDEDFSSRCHIKDLWVVVTVLEWIRRGHEFHLVALEEHHGGRGAECGMNALPVRSGW